MAVMKIVNRAGGRVDEEQDKSLAGHLLTNKTLTKPALELSILNLQIGTFTRASTMTADFIKYSVGVEIDNI